MKSKFESTVNKCLSDMSKVSGTDKGSFGEKAVMRVCEELYQKNGGILYHSYVYGTTPGLEGNIKKDTSGKLFVENTSTSTEIDVLYVTEYKIFPIEVKAYRAKKIVLTDEEISGCYKVDKSPVHQNEMHCRHLYPRIVMALPNGSSGYIEPIVVFVDECTVEDNRSSQQKAYIKVVTLNMLRQTLEKLNKPGEYRLDLDAINRCLVDACISSEKHFKLRKKNWG